MNRNSMLLLLGVVVALASADSVPQRRYAEKIRLLEEHLQEAKRRRLQSGAHSAGFTNNNKNVNVGSVAAPAEEEPAQEASQVPPPFYVNNGDLTCEVLEEAFDLPAWKDSTCSCQGNSAAKQTNYDLTVTCVDNFECCSHEESEVCVTNSFQQIINKETYEAMDTTEYFHYSKGREGTITLYHICGDAGCTCSMHIGVDRCASCEWVNCDGEQNPSFDCSNVAGGAVFDYCPSSTVEGLDTTQPIGALQDGYIDYIDNCKPLPGFVVPHLGGLHNLGGKNSAAFAHKFSAVAAAASVVLGLFFL